MPAAGAAGCVAAGLLVQPDESGPLATLAHNTAGRFEDRWIHLEVRPGKCPFLKDIERLYLPVAHGEGCYVADPATLEQLESEDRIVLRYKENPNGSMRDIAGIVNGQRNVMGMMPHPENHVEPAMGCTDGRGLFAGLVDHVARAT